MLKESKMLLGGIYLYCGILDAMLYALCGLLGEVVLPNLFDPADHVPEFIEKGHLVEVLIQRGSR